MSLALAHMARTGARTDQLELRAGVDFSPAPMRCTCGGHPKVTVADNLARALCTGGCGRSVAVPVRVPPNCHSAPMARRLACKAMGRLMREWNVDVLRPSEVVR